MYKRLGRNGSKVFFFEKKKQKTSGSAGVGDGGATAVANQSFFGSFCSQKELLA
jgi:hypothetical protein